MTNSHDPSFVLPRLLEHEMALFAQLLAVITRPGDVIALEGEVGAGKTTFARAFIRAFLANKTEEIPSPTYTLVQTYATDRLNIAHFDLYRLTDPDELGELGLDHALSDGVAIIEWPGNAGNQLPASRLHLHLCDPDDAPGKNPSPNETRDLSVHAFGSWIERAKRLNAMIDLVGEAGWYDNLHSISYLAGDASARRYARLTANDGRRALLMDWPHVADTKVVRDGKTYNQIAHIADNVAPFIAVSNALCAQRFSAPEILGSDIDNGLVILEDLGDQVFYDEVKKGVAMPDLWRAATDTLIALRTQPVPRQIPVPGGHPHTLPRFDRAAMSAEIELLADWYWPSVHGTPMPEPTRARFSSLWNTVIDRILLEPPAWIMRDFHSPNLVAMADRSGKRAVGIIDFQDALAGPASYDLVSLLQDARLDVPADLEAQLLEHYCATVSKAEPGFNQKSFVYSYAAMGAQRNTKILGIFARLAKRDGKPQYLAHIPRIWGYLSRDLQHPGLSELASWYEQAFNPDTRPINKGS